MEEMRELVTVEQAERALLLLTAALPALGLLAGAVVGGLRRRLTAGLGLGLACGLAGPLLLGLWRAYNAIMGRYGLDSVKALLLNLGLFLAVGAAIGLAAGVALRRWSGGEDRHQSERE